MVGVNNADVCPTQAINRVRSNANTTLLMTDLLNILNYQHTPIRDLLI